MSNYCFLPALQVQLIPNTPYCYKLIQYVCVVLSMLVKRCGHVAHSTKQNIRNFANSTRNTQQRMIQKRMVLYVQLKQFVM